MKTILLAEDSATIRKAVEITFAVEDVHLTTVADADAALASAAQTPPDLIIADLSLPGKTGYDLCSELRVRGDSTPVLFLHGPQASYDQAKGTSVGGNGELEKPFETQALIDKVMGLLGAAKREQSSLNRIEPLAPLIQSGDPPADATDDGLIDMIAASPADPMEITIEAEPPPQASREPLPSFGALAAAPPEPDPVGVPDVTAPAPIVDEAAGALGALPPQQTSNPMKSAMTLLGTGFDPPQLPPPPPGMPLPPGARDPGAGAGPTATSPVEQPDPTAPAAQELDPAIYQAVQKLSRDVIEQIVWEVVPDLAETVIREELDRLIEQRAK